MVTTDRTSHSPSRRISVAVNELLGATGVVKGVDLVDASAAEIDGAVAVPGPPAWISTDSGGDFEGVSAWIADKLNAHRTGVVRSYTSRSVTGASKTSDHLEGVKYSHKDNLGVEGLPISAGSPSLESRYSTVTSPVLSAVEAAGGSLIGANHMAEFAMSPTGHNQWLGDGVNPLDTEYYSGGSSSGSAISVARGECDVSFGTDTGGSVRLPAAFCGLFGYKPTNGLFSQAGLIPLSNTLDTIGLLSRDIADLSTTLEILLNDDAVVNAAARAEVERKEGQSESTISHLDSRSVAHECDPTVTRAFEAAIERLGCTRESHFAAELPELERRSVVVVSVEAAHNVGRLLGFDWSLLGDQVLSRVIRGTAVSAIEYAETINGRQSIAQSFVDRHLSDSRFIIMPSSPILAPKVARTDDSASELVRRDYMRASMFTRFTNYLGLPAITIPLPSGKQGLRPALQVMGRPFDDVALVDYAQSIDRVINL